MELYIAIALSFVGGAVIGFCFGSLYGGEADPYDVGSPEEQAWRANKDDYRYWIKEGKG